MTPPGGARRDARVPTTLRRHSRAGAYPPGGLPGQPARIRGDAALLAESSLLLAAAVPGAQNGSLW